MIEKPRNLSAITVIIPNWNGRELLRNCLYSLQKQIFKNFEIVVVDNASEDGSCAMLDTEFPNVRVYSMQENQGFSRAVNYGIKQSNTPFIMLLNNDTEVEPSCLERLYQNLDGADNKCGGVQCRMMNYDERDRIDTLGIQFRLYRFCDIAQGEHFMSKYENNGCVLGLCAGAALYRRRFFEHVGYFDERFFAGFEDVDISLRGIWHDWYFTYEPCAVVYHHKSLTFNKLSFQKTLELRKNYYLLAYKNFPRRFLLKLTGRLLNTLQKDCFNIAGHFRKGRLRQLAKMYVMLFSHFLRIRSERNHDGITDDTFIEILGQSEQDGIWQAKR